MDNRFYSLREKIALFFLLLVSVGSLFFFFQFKTFAFPEYNIAFSTTRSESTEKAKQFLSEMQISKDGYKDVTVFTVDDESKTYLERKGTVQQTAKFAENDIDLWHFTTRFFKPLEKEEYTVSFLPNGRLSGFNRTVAEDKSGSSLSQQEAQLVAEQFLETKTNMSLHEWELIDVNMISRKKRTDYQFIWETTKFHIPDGTYRKEISLIGDQIGGYAEYLKVPETWQRAYVQERSQNDLAQTVAEVISFLLFGISAVLFFILQYKNNKLRFRMGSYIALATFIIVFLATLNSLSLAIFSYETTQSWEAFLGQIFLEAILAGGMLASINFFIIVVGESLYRKLRPQHIAIEQVFKRGIATKQVNKSLLIGSFAGIISFGYVVLFYIVGRNFNFWSPAEINYNDAFSTYIPWIYPLFIGFTAAVFEEGLFRLFGIPFLIRFVKKPWIAVVITAFAWGFLHSNYPQSPWFARGIEVGIEGLLLGFLFLRFGILTSIISHYTFNALITSVALASSASLLNSGLSFFFALLPLLIGIIFLVRALLKKGFVTNIAQLTNQYIESITKNSKEKIKQTQEQIVRTYQGIVTKRFVILTSVLTAASLVAVFFIAPDIDGAMQANTITRSDALLLAKKDLMRKNIPADSYQSVVTYVSSPPSDLEQEYILQYADFDTIQKIYPGEIPTNYWTIRFFKPLEKEEYHVYLLPNGAVYSIDHLIGEDTKGANLSKQEALQIAEKYLQQQDEYVPSYTLIATETKKRKNRTDYYFSFQDTEHTIKEATVRSDIEIIGDEPSGFQKYIKLPEEWIREKEKTTSFDFIFDLALVLPILLLLIYLVGTFFNLIKKKSIQYKQVFLLALPFFGVSLVQVLNQSPTFFASYPTSIPLGTYVIENVLGMTVGQVVSFFLLTVIIGMFLALWKIHIGTLFPTNTKERWQYIRDALFIGYMFPFLIIGYGVVIMYISLKYKLFPSLLIPEVITGIDHIFPSFTVIDTLITAIIGLTTIVVILLTVYRKSKSAINVAGALLFLLLLSEAKELLGTTMSLHIILLQLGIIIVSFSLVTFIILRVIKTNLLAYGMMLFSSILFANALDFVSQEHLFFQINGYLLCGLGVLPIVGYFFIKRFLVDSFVRGNLLRKRFEDS